ncbi:rhodanese-like domain-containing protein [Candidatus Mycobacterium wuenschmannii]|uniref:Rhodanese-like domain-containing protein n=1 Tax=Candidatus Mycobacterium wuenschmannii TaxID=3027808 RepID=A0ABY8W0F1_9MYCO|nr:rhodanese-like domain-containing protein [Candidatus Mycobacterium wuenschmannii]WIM89338.1 rhodanese-like domain-containing protein [Candidatus Mycobacterium wuenschmannii]
MTAAITSSELRERIVSEAPLWILDVRTPAEFETSHIDGSLNVPLDLLNEHAPTVAETLDRDRDIVLVCRSGQRATQAQQLLQRAGVGNGTVLEKGIADWEGQGFDVQRGVQRWDLERQVRLVAGSIVLSAVLGSVAIPKLKWLAAAIGGGLTFAAVSNTCAMGNALSRLPYNRGATTDTETVLSQLASGPDGNR